MIPMLHLFIVAILILTMNVATPSRENRSYQAPDFTVILRISR